MVTASPSAISVPAGGSGGRTPAAPGAVSAGSGAWRGVSPASRSFWRASGTVSPVTCGTATSLGRAERYAANAATTHGRDERPGRQRRALLEGGLGGRAPRRDVHRHGLTAAQPAPRAVHLEPGDHVLAGLDMDARRRHGTAELADVLAGRRRGRDRRGQIDVSGGVAVVADVDLGVGAAAGTQLLRAQLQRDDGVRRDADPGRSGPDAAAAGKRDHAQWPLGGLQVGMGWDVDGDVGLALLARGDVNGPREDLGPAGGHALDGQLEVLGARGLVVHAHDEARVRGRLDDDLGRPGVIRASRDAQRDADRVPMPSCSPFPEHLMRG